MLRSALRRPSLPWLALLAACGGLPDKDRLFDPDGDGVDWPADCASTDDDIPAEEAPYNDVDDDCDPATPDDDLDGDGVNAAQTGGGDCDDVDPTRYPGAPEQCSDQRINDCLGDEESARRACGFPGERPISEGGLRFTGEAAGDESGVFVAGLGDVSGDGRPDIGVSSWLNDRAGEDAGAAHLLFSDGALDGSSAGLATAADRVLLGERAGDSAGLPINAAGDVDGDGLADLLVCARYGRYGEAPVGVLYVLLGSRLTSAELSLADAAWRFGGDAQSEQLCHSATRVGDLDGDGREDLWVSAPLANPSGSEDVGMAYILLSGGALSAPHGTYDLSAADILVYGQDANDRAGLLERPIGDLDGDGRADLVIGRPGAGGQAGAVSVLLSGELRAGWPAQLLPSAAGAVQLAGETGQAEQLGQHLAGLRDLDGDGLDELMVSAHARDDGAAAGDAGAVTLIAGATLAELAGTSPALDEVAWITLIGEGPNNFAGYSIADAGDFDGDGRSDIAVGAIGAGGVGAAYLVPGAALEGVNRPTVSLAEVGLKLYGDAPSTTGHSVDGAGDIDGDGYDDLVVGAHQDDAPGTDAGAVYVVFGFGI